MGDNISGVSSMEFYVGGDLHNQIGQWAPMFQIRARAKILNPIILDILQTLVENLVPPVRYRQ